MENRNLTQNFRGLGTPFGGNQSHFTYNYRAEQTLWTVGEAPYRKEISNSRHGMRGLAHENRQHSSAPWRVDEDPYREEISNPQVGVRDLAHENGQHSSAPWRVDEDPYREEISNPRVGVQGLANENTQHSSTPWRAGEETYREEINSPRVGVQGLTHENTQHSSTAEKVQEGLSKKQRKKLRRRMAQEQRSEAAPILMPGTSNYRERSRLNQSGSVLSTGGSGLTSNSPKSKRDKKLISFAIGKYGFPSKALNKEQVEIIRSEILRRVDEIPDGDYLPKIFSTNHRGGVLEFFCKEPATVEWVKNVFDCNDLLLGGIMLRFRSSIGKAKKPAIVAFKTKDTVTLEPDVLLSRLQRYNPELRSEGWRVLQNSVKLYYARWIFEIEPADAEAVRKADCRAYTGLDNGLFKILREPNKKSTAEQESLGAQAFFSQDQNQ